MGGNYVWGDFCSISDRHLVFSVKCRSRSASDSDQEQTPTSSALGLVVLFFFIFHGWPGFSAGHFSWLRLDRFPFHPTETFFSALQTMSGVSLLVLMANDRFIKITYRHTGIDKPRNSAAYAGCFSPSNAG